MRDTGHPFDRWTAPIVATLSLGAAAIHFSVIGAHYAEYPLFGLLFAGLAWFQAGWALWFALRPERVPALLAIALNSGAVLVWVISRTAGMPVGPAPWTAEPIGALDALATTMEVALVALLVWAMVAAERRAASVPQARSSGAIAGISALLVAFVTSAVLATSAGTGHDADHDHQAPAAAEPTEAADSTTGDPLITEGPGDSGHHPAVSGPPPPASSPPPASPSAASAAPPPESGTIVFGRDLDAAGRISQPIQRFAEGEFAVWVANLSSPPGVGTLRFVVVQRLPNDREFPHWDQALEAADPDQRTIVSSGALSDFAHGGPGTYAMRYVRDGEVLAEGVFELTP